MKATQTQLLNLLDGRRQFIIPIYQRSYSWQIKQCEQLLNDILEVGNDVKAFSHFIGSVVYFPENSTISSVHKLFVIDGQQRFMTVSLMLLALIHFLKDHKNVLLGDNET